MRATWVSKAALVFIIYSQMWYSIEASGKLLLRFMKYSNEAKEDKAGLCCDGWIGLCGNCDHRFLFCVDKPTGSNSMSSCSFWRKQTGEFADTNINIFGSNMHGFQNPVQIPFDKWPGGIKMKIYVTDDDRPHSGDDAVDDLIAIIPIRAHKSFAGLTNDDMETKVIWGNRGPDHPDPTGMTFGYLVWCDDNYYTGGCHVYCKPQNNSRDHFTCDPETGEKVCLPGWEEDPVSKTCTVFADDCVGNACMNEAECIDGERNYTCECAPGYKGQFCEIVEEHCDPNPCKNGGVCTNFPTDYKCNCTPQYTGKNCTCTRGDSCETCKEEHLGCQNNAPCEDGTCQCPKGFVGEKCQLDICQLFIECEHSGICLNGKCNCTPGYTGRYCHRDIDECLSSPCQNLGACKDLVNGYRCECNPSYSGKHCENALENSVTLKITDNGDRRSNHIREDDGDPRAEKVIEAAGNNLWLVGVVIGIVMLLIIIIVILLSLLFRQRRKKRLQQTQQNQTRESANMDHIDNPLFATGAGSPHSTEDPYSDIGPGAGGGRGGHAGSNGVMLSPDKLKAFGDVAQPPPYSQQDLILQNQENEYDIPPSRSNGFVNPAYDEAPPLPTKTKPKFVNDDM